LGQGLTFATTANTEVDTQ